MSTEPRESKNAQDKDEIIAALPMACANETAAVEFFEKQRWGDHPGCVHCGSTEVYQMRDKDGVTRNKRFLWRCRDCKGQFTVRIGTVFEESRIPLRHWAFAFWRAATSKKGVAALEIKRQTGLSYKSALFMMHRVRWAMAPVNERDERDNGKLTGTVEVDETYVGGKPRYGTFAFRGVPKLLRPKGKSNYATRKDRHTPVFAAVQRGGKARARVMPVVNSETLADAVREHVDKAARLMTDEHSGYKRVGKEYASHESVKHSTHEYVRGDVTTNTIESFFAILKRSIIGIHHNVSREHLQRYLDHIEFLYNHRDLEDGDRVLAAIRGMEGKRLMVGYIVPDDTEVQSDDATKASA
jgi:transposase-like protein